MLLRFTVENTLSFNSEASISLIATSDRSHPDHLQYPVGSKRPPALRAAAVYGANGHGKSKLVESVIALQRHVRGKPWSATPFKLDPAASLKPTKMVLEFRYGDHDYEYGTLIFKDYVSEEWLFATNSDGNEEKIFERATNKTEEGKFKTTIHPGKAISSLPSPTDEVKMATFLKVLGSGIRPNQSFISEAEDRELGLLTQAFNWFDKVLTPVSASSSYSPLFDRLTDEEKFRNFIGSYMSNCDVGIERIEIDRTKVGIAFFDTMPPNFRTELEELEHSSVIEISADDGPSMQVERDANGDYFVRDLSSIRRDTSNNIVRFNLDEESSGTRRLLDLLPMIADGGDARVYVVDELDRKLHPLLAYEFVNSFLKCKSQQLIFTTHNTHLMSLDLLRRDEIWFVQKRDDGSSDLYALAEMKVRNDLNIKKGYISGRFGAIPFIGNIGELGWNKSIEEAHAAN